MDIHAPVDELFQTCSQQYWETTILRLSDTQNYTIVKLISLEGVSLNIFMVYLKYMVLISVSRIWIQNFLWNDEYVTFVYIFFC